MLKLRLGSGPSTIEKSKAIPNVASRCRDQRLNLLIRRRARTRLSPSITVSGPTTDSRRTLMVSPVRRMDKASMRINRRCTSPSVGKCSTTPGKAITAACSRTGRPARVRVTPWLVMEPIRVLCLLLAMRFSRELRRVRQMSLKIPSTRSNFRCSKSTTRKCKICSLRIRN